LGWGACNGYSKEAMHVIPLFSERLATTRLLRMCEGCVTVQYRYHTISGTIDTMISRDLEIFNVWYGATHPQHARRRFNLLNNLSHNRGIAITCIASFEYPLQAPHPKKWSSNSIQRNVPTHATTSSNYAVRKPRRNDHIMATR